jgi:hypothetical protein
MDYYAHEGAVLDDNAARRMKFDYRCIAARQTNGDAGSATQ